MSSICAEYTGSVPALGTGTSSHSISRSPRSSSSSLRASCEKAAAQVSREESLNALFGTWLNSGPPSPCHPAHGSAAGRTHRLGPYHADVGHTVAAGHAGRRHIQQDLARIVHGPQACATASVPLIPQCPGGTCGRSRLLHLGSASPITPYSTLSKSYRCSSGALSARCRGRSARPAACATSCGFVAALTCGVTGWVATRGRSNRAPRKSCGQGRVLVSPSWRGRAFQPGLDDDIADQAPARNGRQLAVPEPARRPPGPKPGVPTPWPLDHGLACS